MLTIKMLKTFLNQFPDDTELVETRYSDLQPMSLDSWSTVQGIYNVRSYSLPRVSNEEWIQHILRPGQLNKENKAKLKTFIHFAGN